MRPIQDGDENKLPKWAQYKLSVLRRIIEERDERIKALERAPGGSKTAFIVSYQQYPKWERYKIPLAQDRVLFATGKMSGGMPEEYEIYVDPDGDLKVYGSGTLLIKPRASNSISIQTEGVK